MLGIFVLLLTFYLSFMLNAHLKTPLIDLKTAVIVSQNISAGSQAKEIVHFNHSGP